MHKVNSVACLWSWTGWIEHEYLTCAAKLIVKPAFLWAFCYFEFVKLSVVDTYWKRLGI